MTVVAPPAGTPSDRPDEPWYVYDRHLNLLAIEMTLADAEAWAIRHWGVVEVAGRELIENNDYWYLLFAAPDETGSASRDYQARITRKDRVVAMGRDADTPPRFPSGDPHPDS